jgi:transcriptional regulator with XRE-family HTH domain
MELALYAGVSRNEVQDLEAGKGRASWKNLRAVLGVLNIRLEPAGSCRSVRFRSVPG